MLCCPCHQKTGIAFNVNLCQKIKFEHSEIDVLKILVFRTACINPCFLNAY